MTTTQQTSQSPSTDVEVANTGIMRRFVAEVVNEGRHETISEIVHPHYRYHGPDGSELAGADAAWRITGALRAAFSDLHAEIISDMAQGDRVVLTLNVTGTHDGDFMGIPATGARIELPMAVVSRLEDRRIIEEWEYYDSAILMGQITSSPADDRQTLVLGGSGKTGRRVVDRLRAAGTPVRAASRSGETPFDWEDESTWAPALDGMGAVYITYYPDLRSPARQRSSAGSPIWLSPTASADWCCSPDGEKMAPAGPSNGFRSRAPTGRLSGARSSTRTSPK